MPLDRLDRDSARIGIANKNNAMAIRCLAILTASLAMLSGSAMVVAQEATAAAPEDDAIQIVVTGKRASLISAREIKRDRLEIVDAVVADDINKLPDVSVTDALQRVTGVQIGRDRGEGANVAIRGLTQMETQLNGREVFTAGNGRNLDFADIPAEMVAGIDVYKTPATNHIEGGVGGTIDLRTRRPFDFKDGQFVVSGRAIHGDLADKTREQYSMLLSKRWKTADGGTFGALLNLAHQERAWREDQKSAGNPIARSDIIPGRTVVAPNGTTETTSVGERKRTAGTLILQWRPSPGLDLYAEGSYAEFRTLQDSYQINIAAAPTFATGSAELFAGSNDLRRITWTNAPISIMSFARDTVDRTQQLALGGTWHGQALTLKADISHTRSLNTLFFSGPILAGTAANFTQNLDGRLPATRVTGTDLLDPANFRFSSVAYRRRPFNGDLSTARLDAEYPLAGGFFDSLAAGLRFARRGADNAPGLIFGDTAVSGITAADRPGAVQANPYDNFFPGASASSIRDYLVANLAGARNAGPLRAAFGITTPPPTAGNPLGVWRIAEETRAAYLMARFRTRELPLDGNFGLRAVHTRERVTGSQSLPATGAVAPIAIDNAYLDTLPSANLRLALTDDLYLRAAAAKTITRPDFNQLSPSLTLVRNSVTPALNQGNAGNPELRPVRAENLDIAIEHYAGKSAAYSLTAFRKRVDGFVATVSNPETHYGETYQVSRPQNGNQADIKGLEAAGQQFFDFLPGWLGGFGLQANYTYVASATANSVLGAKVPLQNLSKHSANLVGIYEQGRFSARAAWNWRDKFLAEVRNIVGVGAVPIYMRAYGWLDASLGWRVDERITLALEGTNLLGTLRRSYYGVTTRPQSSWINDIQVAATATIRF